MEFSRVVKLHQGTPHPESPPAIDTTFLFEELRRAFEKTGPVEVDFRQLVGWLKVGDQLTHLLHPYPAKLLPHIAHFFLRCKGAIPQTHVLDPFCGSGTVAVEASISGHIPLVADANPFALLLTKVKTTPYCTETLREITGKLVARAKRLRTAPEISIVNADKWYADDIKRRLEILHRAILELDDEDSRDFFLVCFSATARKVSRIDPAISVPVRLRSKESLSNLQNTRILDRLSWVETARPIDEFYGICHANIARVERANHANPHRRAAVVVGDDARALNASLIPNAGAPLVISSPPYGTAQKYIRASSLSLNWLGYASPKQLASLEGRSIGREHSPAYREEKLTDGLPKEFKALISEIRTKNSLRAHITQQYLEELKTSLCEISKTTAPNGRIVLIIGNNEVCGMTLRTDKYISMVMEEYGCESELVLVDQIKSRGLLTKRNSTASVIAREYIMTFIKKTKCATI